jgi:hypothetical protein
MPIQLVRGSLAQGWIGRGVKLTIHLHLVPWLGISGKIPPLFPCVFMACTKITVPLHRHDTSLLSVRHNTSAREENVHRQRLWSVTTFMTVSTRFCRQSAYIGEEKFHCIICELTKECCGYVLQGCSLTCGLPCIKRFVQLAPCHSSCSCKLTLLYFPYSKAWVYGRSLTGNVGSNPT